MPDASKDDTMRSLTRWLAAIGTGSLLAVTVAAPAVATSQPRDEQWWFGSWSVEKDVWPVSKGAGVTVAVVDSGVNANLPDIRDAVLPGKDIDYADENSTGSGDGRT